MDKTWMDEDRRSHKFGVGLALFLKFASANARDKNKICCPCLKCCNKHGFSINVVKDHIFWNGLDISYRHWRWHGEVSVSYHEDRAGESETVNWGVDDIDLENGGDPDELISEDSNEFLKHVEEGDKPLWPGCSTNTKLNFLIQAFNLKAKHGMTDSCFSDMLLMIGGLLPEENEVPTTLYEAKKILGALGMEYQKIHACPNDCILYRLEHEGASSCPTCLASRWKLGRDNKEKMGVPAKTLWYFPLIPRLRRLYQSSSTAKSLTWHDSGRKKDGLMRHPADSPTWELIDKKWPEFGCEPRNLRFALSSDGFNPHAALSSKYSIWPVVLVIYNLAPWLCMKRKYMMLTLLISGPKQPGNDIDVYLQPLIDDLKILWDGVDRVYDALRGEYFKLRGILLWTINDFPAYGNLSGSIVKGYNGCPICIDNSKPLRLKKGKKMSFMRHRRFLHRSHPYRKQRSAFDNTVEKDDAPVPLSGEEVYARVEGMKCEFGKKCKSAKGVSDQSKPIWKKCSVFFQLEYWKYIPVRHILDVMHIEKNCCEAIIGTLLNIPGKTKDGVAARLDMVDMGIRTALKPKTDAKREKLPLASWNLMVDEKKTVCKSFFGMSAPSNFSSNIRSLVSMQDLRLVGLKSHDCHTVMQTLLPIALRSVLEKAVRYAIIRFCLFFKSICAKVIDPSKLEKMQADLVITVCLLEKYFPPSFFDVMIHLTVHLVREVELCGPVFLRWMYPFERYMKVFKGWVKSRIHVEGSIAECYIVEEAIEYCAEKVLESPSTAGIPDNSKNEVRTVTKPLSGATIVSVYGKEMHEAQLCVLENLEEAEPYFLEHLELLKALYPKKSKDETWLKKAQNKLFPRWLKGRVSDELQVATNNVSEILRWISGGAKNEVAKFSGYMVKGVDFNTKDRDMQRTVQNSGVFLQADTLQVSNARDKNPIADNMHFYGVVEEIWELDYYKFRVPLFKCQWIKNDRGIKVDELGFTLVQLGRLGHLSDSFVSVFHVKQIFYIEDPLDPQWSVVVRCAEKDDQGLDEDEEIEDIGMESELFNATLPSVETFETAQDHYDYVRPGDETIWVEE